MSDNVNTLISRFTKGSILVFAGNLLGIGSQYLIRIIIGRFLSPAIYGLIILGFTLMNFLGIFSLLGLHQGVAQRIPRMKKPDQLFQVAVGTAFLFALATSIVFFLLLEPLSVVLSEPKFKTVGIPFVVAVPFFVLFQMSVGGVRGKHDGKSMFIVQLMYGVSFAFIILAIQAGVDSLDLSIVWSVGIITTSILTLIFLKINTSLFDIRELVYSFTSSLTYFGDVKTLLVFSAPLMISSGVSKLLQQSDNFLISYYTDSNAIGLYDAAFTSAIVILLFTNTTGFLFLPLFSELHEEKRRKKMDRVYKIVTKGMAFCALPIFLTIFIYGSEILNLLFGQEYVEAAVITSIVSTGLFSHVVFGPNQAGLVAIGESKQVLYSNVMALIINFLLNVLLIPVWGIVGAGLASAMSYAMRNIYLTYFLHSKTSVQPFNLRYIIPLLVSAAALAAMHFLYKATMEHSASILSFLVISSLFLHIGIVYSLGLEPNERQILKNAGAQFFQ